MSNELIEFSEIEKAGKIHKKLRNRLLLLGLIAVASMGVLVYDVVWKGLELFPVLGFSSFGFILGFFLFTNINKITWNEEEEMVMIGKFDAATLVILGLYIAYRALMHYYLDQHYTDALLVSGYSLGTLVGGIIGRLIGMVWKINRIHRENAKRTLTT